MLADLLAVANRVVERFGECRQIVLRHHALVTAPRGQNLVNVALALFEFLLQKNGKIDLAHKADTLRIFAFGRSQMLLLGDASHLGFEQPAHGEHRTRELLLRQLTEEVALILVRIATRQQSVTHLAVRALDLLATAVVTRRNVVGAEFKCLFQKDIELDLAVAQHVGVGRATTLILGKHIVHHALSILLREIDHVQRNIQSFGYQLGKNAVVVPRAVAFERTRRVVPIDHKESDHVVALLFEQIGRNRRIDTSRKSYNNALSHLVSVW